MAKSNKMTSVNNCLSLAVSNSLSEMSLDDLEAQIPTKIRRRNALPLNNSLAPFGKSKMDDFQSQRWQEQLQKRLTEQLQAPMVNDFEQMSLQDNTRRRKRPKTRLNITSSSETEAPPAPGK